MKTKIHNLWQELAVQPRTTGTLHFRRFSSEATADIFVGLLDAAGIRFIAFAFDRTLPINVANFNRLRDIRVEVIKAPDDARKSWLLIGLLNVAFEENFALLCADLIGSVQHLTKSRTLLRQILQRLENWQMLFDEMPRTGLSAEAQRGLFGELTLLHRLLEEPGVDATTVIGSWVGPIQHWQDFHHNYQAVEVKTTFATNADRLTISNAFQLDDNMLQALWLVHYWLDVDTENGLTLNALTDRLAGSLTDPTSTRLFQERLLMSGYHALHREQYEQPAYVIRQENYWRVGEGFPRLINTMLPDGIPETKYILLASACRPWQVSEVELFTQFLPHREH